MTMTFKQAAKLILKEAGRPLTADELATQALKR
jgi:HB1/ASXL restriction endonuclease-like protein with HTH domain